MSADDSARDAFAPESVQGDWLREAARGLDPRTRAALDASDPDQAILTLPDEAMNVLAAALRDLLDERETRRGGVAPVVGAGVLAEFRKLARAEAASPSPVEGSHIDERR